MAEIWSELSRGYDNKLSELPIYWQTRSRRPRPGRRRVERLAGRGGGGARRSRRGGRGAVLPPSWPGEGLRSQVVEIP